jgi:hypothetical protein
MRERHAAARSFMPERPRTQHRLDRVRQLETKAKSLRPALVACNSGIGIALMYHEACMKESFD